MTEFRGARGSNTGDDFHELWATRQAIRLLSSDDGLKALVVEGLAKQDEAGASEDTWDGVDCTLYFDGLNAVGARHIVLEQLKYSAAAPDTAWTISRLVGGARRDKSVIARLAKAWKGLAGLRSDGVVPGIVLISNQPVDAEIVSAFVRAATAPLAEKSSKPKSTAAGEIKLAYAAGLNAAEFQAFSSAIGFEGGAGSRFALEEQVLRAIADWTDQDVQRVVTGLRQFIRQRMRPEFAGELITRESIMLHFGASEGIALFPCPSEITQIDAPVSRTPIREATKCLLAGAQYLCLHGSGGVGKTTSLQEIEAELPPGSIMIKYDCYGGGRYMDPSALRHRSTDAFLQLTNELATRLRLPLLLSRHQGSDYPKLFVNRLRHAANAVAMQHPGALVVIAIDAADNAVTAAQSRMPVETSFTQDFVLLTGLPENVRFVVTARTGRLEQLKLPSNYQQILIGPFSRPETSENVKRVWAAPEAWIDDFHHLSSGVPRVQAYAFEIEDAEPFTALDRLRPAGKSLDEVFRQRFEEALNKNGNSSEVARLCAGLIALPRPVPLTDLAGVLNSTELLLADVCADLAPGIRLHDGVASFADEDFEHFVRNEGINQFVDVQKAAASWLLSRASHDRYAALNVATALVSAGRGAELLELVEREPSPVTVADPVLRREAELQRLRLAIKVCREAGDVPRALRFVLIGAEGIKTEAVLRELLVNNPDMAANFAQETAGRLVLFDSEHIGDHGPLLFQKLSVDAERGDAISVREGRRLLEAWMQARKHHHLAKKEQRQDVWKIEISDIASSVKARLKLDGPTAAIHEVGRWTPKSIALDVVASLPLSLIAEGHINDIEAIAASDQLGMMGRLFLLIPLALAGQSVDFGTLENGLKKLSRKLNLKKFFEAYSDKFSTHAYVLDTVLTACEVLTIMGKASELVDKILEDFLAPNFRRVERRQSLEAAKLDILFRAHALREVRAGRKPSKEDIFIPRPKQPEEPKQSRVTRDMEEHDRPLLEITGAVYGIYVAIAEALVDRKTDAELNESLRTAVNSLSREAWRIERQHGSSVIRGYAAKNILVLLAAGYDPYILKQFAIEVHDRWGLGYHFPDERFVARLSLRSELHDSLLKDLIAAATTIRKMRIGAEEKSKTLVRYARLIKPISPLDANAVFNDAVEAASELDREVMAQIRLLDKLIYRGKDTFQDARRTARRVANIVADAAIRLDDDDHFPWDESISSMTQLDTALALANVARWDDDAVVSVRQTLPSLLRTALQNRTLRPAQGVAVALFLDNDEGVLSESLKQAAAAKIPNLSGLVEEVTYDILIRLRQSDNDHVARFIQERNLDGRWSTALIRQGNFLSSLTFDGTPATADEVQLKEKSDSAYKSNVWNRETLLDSEQLRFAINTFREEGRAKQIYSSISEALQNAGSILPPRDRVAYLSSLAGLEGLTSTNEAVKAMLQVIDAWWESPAVKIWCRENLPEVIVSRFPEFLDYLQYGKDDLTPALERTGLSENELQELILRGIERHVDGFGSELIFTLAGLIGDKLPPSEAAGLVDWYAARLADRIPLEEQDQTAQDSVLPQNVDEAVARFVFAYMGDYDLRMRWRAAHVVRRLARLNDEVTLLALISEYSRRDEVVFRSTKLPFYWIAARLWFTLAWDRVAGESPYIARSASPILLQIALDCSFPHLLVRSFARDACEKLITADCLSLNSAENSRLSNVNVSPFPRSSVAKSTKRYISDRDEVRRVKFDPMDTIPYWYRPMLSAFANVDGERFLQTVEHWIIDIWGYDGDIRSFDKERRRGRFEDRNWSLSSNRHGEIPTLERFNNHLEWHAMWCAAGQLLVTDPLVSLDDEESDSWDDLSSRIRREKLFEPPLWASDLLVAIPLIERNWRADTIPLEDWAVGVKEAYHRAEMFPDDQPDYIVVSGETERRMSNRIETIRVSSALVDPARGGALLRTLQTMDDTWDYKLPDENEDHEIAEGPYRLIGWLGWTTRDKGIDEKDPFRGYASTISTFPGSLVAKACGLSRDKSGRASWFNDSEKLPMFIYECWGDVEKDDDRYSTDFSVSGRRLLVHRTQLQKFLLGQMLDLIIEVEVTRRGRENQRYTGEEEKEKPEGRFDRLYRLQSGGTLEIAEGRLGAWSSDRP